MPEVEPALCQVVPLAVDRSLVPTRVAQIEFYGYDFTEATNLSVFLERSTGSRQDVTAFLDRPTHYAMTLKFGADGVQLNDNSRRIVLEWNGQRISTIGIIQPGVPNCEMKIIAFTPSNITFTPKHQKGDENFDGHGPKIEASVTLKPYQHKLDVFVYMKAKETTKDYTTASGSKVYTIYTPDPGWSIAAIVGRRSTSHKYTDTNHQKDSFDQGSGGPVRRFTYVGDTDGDESGTRTQVEVTFNELRIQLRQTGNCTPIT
jgi:hypothetical protein